MMIIILVTWLIDQEGLKGKENLFEQQTSQFFSHCDIFSWCGGHDKKKWKSKSTEFFYQQEFVPS